MKDIIFKNKKGWKFTVDGDGNAFLINRKFLNDCKEKLEYSDSYPPYRAWGKMNDYGSFEFVIAIAQNLKVFFEN